MLDTATTTSVWPLFRSAQIFPTNVTKRKESKNLNVAHLTDLLVLVHHRVVDGGRHLRSFSSSAFTLSSSSSSSSFKKGGNREKQICVEKFFLLSLSLSLSPRGFENKKRERNTSDEKKKKTGRRRRKKRENDDDEGAKSFNHY